MRATGLFVTVVATVATYGNRAAPTLGVGDCVGPKIGFSERLPSGRTDFPPAAAFVATRGLPTTRTITAGDTYLVTEVQGGIPHLKTSSNLRDLAPWTAVASVRTPSATCVRAPHNCFCTPACPA